MLKTPTAKQVVPIARAATLAPSKVTLLAIDPVWGAGRVNLLSRDRRRKTNEINHGELTRPNAQMTPRSQRIPIGTVTDGTKIAQTRRAQAKSAAVSMTSEVAVTEREIPTLVASCNLEAIASKPVGR